MEISRFTEKLNKVEGTIHVVEEEVHLSGGMYEAELQHDNINEATFAVFTGPRLTGERLETYAISTPSMTPWKRIVRVYADVPVVCISYETDGDTVEAEDMNRVQEAVVVTQEALNAEEVRAEGEERRLDGRIDTETARAEMSEQNLADGLASETTRAKAAEQSLTDSLATEVSRAGAAEKVLTDGLTAEVTRAKAAEQANTENITAEVARAKGAEKTLTDHLAEEITRAEASEKILTDDLATEVSRAKAREGQLAGSIDAHTTTVAGEIQALKAADTALDEKKADTTHVNAELGKRYTKEQVYTKEEVLQKIEDLIGSAPDTLDTLREVADALGNDPNFAGTIMNALAGKVDKVAGKQLSANDYSDAEKAVVADVNTKKHTHGNKAVLDKLTQAMLDKLNGIAAGANKYVHPATAGNKHLPSGGVSGQILRWSADGTAAWGTDKDTVYTHPSTHPSSMISEDATHRFLADFCKSITDWNSATTNGFYMASGGTNAPSAAWYFGRVIAHNANYVYQEVYQFTASTDAKVVPKYIRCRMNGTWGSWTNVTVAVSVPGGAKFTDTVYTHPNSGVTAKTYRSVTVNAQGHVTAGANPTTLSGYGITDAAAKTHNHDGTYLKKGPLTWGDLKGV